MSSSVSIGLALTMFAGLLSGNCMLPMKFVRRWRWENTWLVFSIVSLVILPWALALCFVSNLPKIYATLSFTQIAIPFLLGAGWGIAQILFGISVQRLGLGLAYAIIVGLGALLGTLVPLFVQHRSQVSSGALMVIGLGVAAMIVGIGLATWAGRIREHLNQAETVHTSSQGYVVVVLMAILCGFMAPMLNFSFAFGQDIARKAVSLGNSELRAGYAVWPLALAGGFLPNIVYSVFLLQKNHSWKLFKESVPDPAFSALMGTSWMGAFALYGVSATYLGSLGTSIGWGLFQIFMIMTAMLSGVFTGEWKRAPRSAVTLLITGFGSLIAATALLAAANR